MQIGLYFDQTRCTGCYTCIVSCKDWHDVPAGPASWMRVKTFERGTYPDLFVAHLAIACFHCATPLCVQACPVSAISKRESDGVVIVNREMCLGHDRCDMCLQACPYDAPQFGAEENAKMQKCDLCQDRLEEGKKPICVAACPMRALDSGSMDELRSRYRHASEAEGFVQDTRADPSIVFNPRKCTRSLMLRRVDTAPTTVRAK